MLFGSAFQPNAFQLNAFQNAFSGDGQAGQRRLSTYLLQEAALEIDEAKRKKHITTEVKKALGVPARRVRRPEPVEDDFEPAPFALPPRPTIAVQRMQAPDVPAWLPQYATDTGDFVQRYRQEAARRAAADEEMLAFILMALD